MTARLLHFITILLLSFGAAAACSFIWFRSQGGTIMSVQSGSMEPLLSRGDLILTKQKPDYKVGDVVAFTNKNATITHRIESIESGVMNTQYRTKGDANSTPDDPIQKSAIVGSLVYSLPLLGFGIDFLRTPVGLTIFIYIPALFIIIGEFKRLNNYYGGYVHYKRMGHITGPKPLLVIVFGLALIACTTTAYTFAALKSTAVLKSSTISSIPLIQPANQCSSSSSVMVNSHVNQSASSGSVNQSTNTEQTTSVSGNTSNTSAVNISVSLNGGC